MPHRAWPLAVPPPPSIGWCESVFDPAGIVAHANSGTNSDFPNPPVLYYAGVVGYSAGMVVEWTMTFQMLFDAGAREPLLFVQPNGRVQIDIGVPEYAQALQPGLVTLSATVDGVESDVLTLSISDNFYATASWGPAP